MKHCHADPTYFKHVFPPTPTHTNTMNLSRKVKDLFRSIEIVFHAHDAWPLSAIIVLMMCMLYVKGMRLPCIFQ